MRRAKNYLPWLFLSPWLIGLVVFNLFPILATLYYSFTRYNFFKQPNWTGLANYAKLIGDVMFWKSLGNTVYLTFIGVPLSLVFALLVAIFLNQTFRGVGFMRALFYLPSAIPLVAAAVTWAWVLNPSFGILNNILHLVGINGPNWFLDPSWSKPGLVLLMLWTSGYSIMIYLAGLQDIPISLYESAKLDGASNLQLLWYITIPMLQPVTMFVLIIGLLGGLQYFTQALVISAPGTLGPVLNGPPEGSMFFYAMNLYVKAFVNLEMGAASSMAWILFLISAVLIGMLLRRFSWEN